MKLPESHINVTQRSLNDVIILGFPLSTPPSGDGEEKRGLAWPLRKDEVQTSRSVAIGRILCRNVR